MTPSRGAGQEGDFDAAFGEFFGGVKNGVMLDGGGDEVVAGREKAEERHVVALGAAGGEDDLGGAAVEQLCNRSRAWSTAARACWPR